MIPGTIDFIFGALCGGVCGVVMKMMIEEIKDLRDRYRIQVKREYGYYSVYVDNNFYCTCDTLPEAMDEVRRIKKDYNEYYT